MPSTPFCAAARARRVLTERLPGSSPRVCTAVRRRPRPGPAFAARSAAPLDSTMFFENVRSLSCQAVLRGGYWALPTGDVAGVFAAYLGRASSVPDGNGSGFRCAVSPTLDSAMFFENVCALSHHAVLRGGEGAGAGSGGAGSHSGSFATLLVWGPASPHSWAGFRCAFSPTSRLGNVL